MGHAKRDDKPTMIVDADGTKSWYRDGDLHREDGPAVERADGTKEWYRDGDLHREDGPAVERADGTKEWYRDGDLHREDGPAVVWANGTKWWYRDGSRHREDGPAIEWADGTKLWYRDGKLHREDGPAVEHPDGTKSWYRDGKLHREDGPAVERANGAKWWWIDGVRQEGPPASTIIDTSPAVEMVSQLTASVGPTDDTGRPAIALRPTRDISPRFYTIKEASRIARISPRVLRSRRERRMPPHYVHIGQAVLYPIESFEQWISEMVNCGEPFPRGGK